MSDEATRPESDQPEYCRSSSRRQFLTGAVAFGTAAAGLSAPADAARAEPAKGGAAVNPRLFSFVGGKGGEWSVVSAKGEIRSAPVTVKVAR